MSKQLSFKKTLLGFSKMTAFILVMLSSFYVNGQSTRPAKWTDVNSRTANFYQLQKDFNQYWQDRKIEKGKGYKAFKRWEAYMQPRVYPSGNLSLPSTNYDNYISWQQNNPQGKGGGSANALTTGNWTELGPVGKPGGCVQCTGAGRVNFVRFDPTNSNIMYIGAPDGGLWKTTNGGTSWTTNTDFLTLIGVSDLAIDPTNTNIMYLATGDIEGAKNSIGVLKSTNGGATWNTTGLTFNVSDYYRIGKMLMHPTNSSILIVATNGGIYRTTNGGTSWTLTQCCGLFQDMEFKPGDPNTVYASGYEFWKSTDNGVNWSQVTAGLPSANIQRIALGVTAGNSAYVYALIGKASDQSFLGMYRSTNSGTSFTLRSSSPNLLGYDTDGLDAGGQAFYDLSIAVNPSNPEVVTTGGVNQWQSTNGGTNWTIKSYWFGGGANPPFVHADVHEINYLPGSSTTFFSCNDGGFFKTTDGGTTWTDLSNNLAITQEIKIGLSASDANTYVIGTQDNGTSKHSASTWTNIFGGDGGECFIDKTNNNTIYISYVYADWYRSTNGGTSFTNITSGLPASGSDFYSTWHQDPVTANTLYCGGFTAFYKSTNQGTNWSVLGTPTGSGNIVDFAVAPSSPTTIYAIKYNAISKSTNGGTSFSNITGTLPVGSAALTNLCVSNTDPLKVWVTFSGYSAGNKVFKSTNGGTSWTNVSTGLPNLPMNTIVYKNGSANDEVYVGGDVGVYYRDNTLASWAAFNTDLPNVGVTDLEIYYPTGKLRAGTYGRGTWESDLNSTGGGCGTPTGLSATSITQTGATLNWGAVASATSYNIQYRVSPAGAWTTTTSATNSKAISGLTANTAYDFQVQAVCTSAGVYSTIYTFTTLAGGCGTPIGLSATSITQTGATLNWGAVASATSYNIQYRVSPAGAWTTTTSATNSKAISGLTANTAYDFHVQAVCASAGTYSSIYTFTTLTSTGCGIPASKSAGSITTTGATITYAAVSGATQYNIQYRVNGTTTWTKKSSTTLSKVLTGLLPGTVYNYRVRANCSGVYSTYTSISNFTTLTLAGGCNGSDAYEPNDTKATPALIVKNTDIYPLISSPTDLDYFKFTTAVSEPKIKVTIDGLPDDYDVILYLASSGAQLGISQNAGTTAEQIIYNAGTTGVTYKVYVYGYGGVYNATSCYHLKVSTSASNWREIGSSDFASDKPGSFSLYPNPANNQLTADIMCNKNQTSAIDVIDMIGSKALSLTTDLNEGENKVDMDVSSLPNGVYTVQVNINGQILVQKLIIQK